MCLSVCLEKASHPPALGFPWVQLPPEYRGSGLRNKVGAMQHQGMLGVFLTYKLIKITNMEEGLKTLHSPWDVVPITN